MKLEPETLKSINNKYNRREGNTYRCGCEQRRTKAGPDGVRWFLCLYHNGFDAGAEAARVEP